MLAVFTASQKTLPSEMEANATVGGYVVLTLF